MHSTWMEETRGVLAGASSEPAVSWEVREASAGSQLAPPPTVLVQMGSSTALQPLAVQVAEPGWPPVLSAVQAMVTLRPCGGCEGEGQGLGGRGHAHE